MVSVLRVPRRCGGRLADAERMARYQLMKLERALGKLEHVQESQSRHQSDVCVTEQLLQVRMTQAQMLVKVLGACYETVKKPEISRLWRHCKCVLTRPQRAPY